jgi:hypothetical protein
MLFDAGLHPRLLKWLSIGSSLDRSARAQALLRRTVACGIRSVRRVREAPKATHKPPRLQPMIAKVMDVALARFPANLYAEQMIAK